MQWMADLDVDLLFQINFPKKLDHRLSMWTHFCKFFEDFATLLYLNANLYICRRERTFSTNWTTLIVSCLLLTKHVSTFLFILRLVRGLILFTLCVLKLPLETNVCIAIYLSFHMAVSLDDIITLWVEVQRSMIIDHLFSPIRGHSKTTWTRF